MLQLGDGFPARRRIKPLEERKPRRVHIHRSREGAGLPHHPHFLFHRRLVPGLHRRDAGSARFTDRGNRRREDAGIRPVPGERGDAKLSACGNQQLVVARVIVDIAVVHVDRPHRAREERIPEGPSEQFKRRIGLRGLRDRIHIHADFLPRVVVPDRRVSGSLRPRSRDLTAAGASVADRTRLAVFSHTVFCLRQHFLICHHSLILLYLSPSPRLWPTSRSPASTF